MTSLADFPNLRSPLWDTVRIPRRETAASIGARMSRDAGFDPDEVRVIRLNRKGTPPGMLELRCRIALAMNSHGLVERDAMQWFEGIELGTYRRYLVDARRMEREGALS
jgi:hypothetical protein